MRRAAPKAGPGGRFYACCPLIVGAPLCFIVPREFILPWCGVYSPSSPHPRSCGGAQGERREKNVEEKNKMHEKKKESLSGNAVRQGDAKRRHHVRSSRSPSYS